jgi:hypothetical protein
MAGESIEPHVGRDVLVIGDGRCDLTVWVGVNAPQFLPSVAAMVEMQCVSLGFGTLPSKVSQIVPFSYAPLARLYIEYFHFLKFD